MLTMRWSILQRPERENYTCSKYLSAQTLPLPFMIDSALQHECTVEKAYNPSRTYNSLSNCRITPLLLSGK
jgi:hypothetical protein